MRLSYKQITFSEYRAAFRMFRRKNLFLRYDQIFWIIVCIASLVVFGIVNDHGGGKALHGLASTIFYYSLCLAAGLPLLRNLNALTGFRAYRKNRDGSVETITEIDENRIVDITPGTCELIYEWKSVTGIGQNDRITVICTRGSHFLFFPTSAFRPEQLIEFNRIASGYGVRRWS